MRSNQDALVTLTPDSLPAHTRLTTTADAAAAGVQAVDLPTCTEADDACTGVFPASLAAGGTAAKAIGPLNPARLAVHFTIATRGFWPQSALQAQQPLPQGSTRPAARSKTCGYGCNIVFCRMGG